MQKVKVYDLPAQPTVSVLFTALDIQVDAACLELRAGLPYRSVGLFRFEGKAWCDQQLSALTKRS